MTLKGMNRDLRGLVKKAQDQGWRLEHTRRTGHVRCLAPDGKTTVVVPGTPSDHRGIKNARAAFKRAGVDV